MKIQGIVLLAILATSVFVGGKISSGADKEPMQSYDEQITQIEDLWKSGKPREYYLRAKEIATNIVADSATSNLYPVAARLLGDLISKETSNETILQLDIDREDLFVMKKLASYLLANRKASAEERRTNILLLSMYLGKIRKEIIPNHEYKRVVPNVTPPGGVPMAFSGMDPAAIKDPVLRAKYEAARRENHENNLMNSRQTYLRKMDRDATRSVMRLYMIQTFRGTDASLDLLRKCMMEAKLTDSEQKEVVAKVARQK